MFAGSAPDSMIEETNAANSGGAQPCSDDNSVWMKSKPNTGSKSKEGVELSDQDLEKVGGGFCIPFFPSTRPKTRSKPIVLGGVDGESKDDKHKDEIH